MFPGQLLRVTGETTSLVTDAEFKNHVREDLSDATNDAYIQCLLSAATVLAEQFTGRTTVNATYVYYLNSWPSELYLPRPPISSITSITYCDTAGTTQTWSSTKYEKETYTGRVRPVYNESFPSVREKSQSIAITYVAGYGASAASTPTAFKIAVMQIAAAWYENRKAIDQDGSRQALEMPLAGKNLLWPFRLKEFA